MIRIAFVVLSLGLAPVASASAPAAAPLMVVAKAKKDPKKPRDHKKKGGPFTTCAALASKAACEAHAKDHSCSWDPIAAGGACGDGPPM